MNDPITRPTGPTERIADMERRANDVADYIAAIQDEGRKLADMCDALAQTLARLVAKEAESRS